MAIGETKAHGLIRKWQFRISMGLCPYCNTRSKKLKIKVIQHEAKVPRAPYDPTMMHVIKNFTHVDCRKGPCKKYHIFPWTVRSEITTQKNLIAKVRKKFSS